MIAYVRRHARWLPLWSLMAVGYALVFWQIVKWFSA